MGRRRARNTFAESGHAPCQKLSDGAILSVLCFPVKLCPLSGLLDYLGAPTVDWGRRHTTGIQWLGGRRQSTELMSTAVATRPSLGRGCSEPPWRHLAGWPVPHAGTPACAWALLGRPGAAVTMARHVT